LLERVDCQSQVLLIRAVGRISLADYREVLFPAVEAFIATYGELRIVYLLGDEYLGTSYPVAWKRRLDQGLFARFTWLRRDSAEWKRCAVVTDHDWVREEFRTVGGGFERKTFDQASVDAAIKWAANPDRDAGARPLFDDRMSVLRLVEAGSVMGVEMPSRSSSVRSWLFVYPRTRLDPRAQRLNHMLFLREHNYWVVIREYDSNAITRGGPYVEGDDVTTTYQSDVRGYRALFHVLRDLGVDVAGLNLRLTR
jgi:SpoIIAA-like